MNKLNRKLLFAAALLIGAINFGACSSASTNTVSTGNTNAAGTANTANANKANAAAPSSANAAPANATSEVKLPAKKEDMLSADTAKTETAGEKIGVPECDEYIAKYEACLSKIPGAQRDAMTTSLQEMQKNWRAAAANPQTKAALAGGCKQAITAAKQTMSQYSCDW